MNVIISATDIALVISKSFLYKLFFDLIAITSVVTAIARGNNAKTRIKNI